ncbi:hypothetical protein ACS0TY_017349 [Phlomoides rotata]
MKFLLEFVTCCTSSPSEPQPPPEESKLFVVQPQVPRRRVPRKHWRVRGAGRHEWRPSLTSISEEILTAEKVNNVDRPVRRRRWSLIKRKTASISQRDRSRSVDHEDCRSSTPLSSLMLSPTPFMF